MQLMSIHCTLTTLSTEGTEYVLHFRRKRETLKKCDVAAAAVAL